MTAAAERLATAERELNAARAAVAAENEAQWAVRGAEAGRQEARRRIAQRSAGQAPGNGEPVDPEARQTSAEAGRSEAARRHSSRISN